MKVAVLSPGAGRTWRGYEVFALELHRFLLAHGVDSTLLAGGVVSEPSVTRIRSLHRDARPSRHVARLLRWNTTTPEQLTFAAAATPYVLYLRPDVVVASESSVLAALGRVPGLRGANRAKLVLTNGGSRQAPFAYADLVIHHAPDLCDRAARSEGRNRHIMLPCPVSIPELCLVEQARASRADVLHRYGIPASRRVIVVVGAIDRSVKRTDYIVTELAPHMVRENLHLALVGTESAEGKPITQLAKSLLNDRVTSVAVAPGDVFALMTAADLHVSASLAEGFGRVFVEAQGACTRSVVHDSPRTRWVLGDRATYVDMQTTGSLRAALPAALQEGRTTEDWQHARRHSWDVVGPSYLSHLTRLARSGPS